MPTDISRGLLHTILMPISFDSSISNGQSPLAFIYHPSVVLSFSVEFSPSVVSYSSVDPYPSVVPPSSQPLFVSPLVP